ncbi:MAG TPA: pyroglutamyl-peptidase I, partial [Xanthobacteraceae bacterium]|nr:pyroglutamyl-peptidase I [Xanthobacteraceae bacterium]
MERSAEAPRNSGRAMGKSLTVLITGFGPFPGARFNPSGPLVRALARRRRPAFADLRRIGHVFATRYEAVDRELPALIARHRPAAVLMFGLATRTPVLRIETRARNVRSAVLPDAGGSLPLHRSITADGGPEKRGRAPFARLVRAARRARMPARLSHDAGQYLCNYTYWRALEGLESRSPDALAV